MKNKAFVKGVSVLDSNPDAYNFVKKKYKMRSAEEGMKVSNNNLIDWIINEEGFLDYPKDIGDGKLTIGSGLTNPKWIAKYNKTGVWTPEDNRAAVSEEIETRRKWAEENVPNWNILPLDSQNALLSYKYNYDFNKKNSPKLYEALSNKNYEEAARQIDATSGNPKFKKGLLARRQREQELFRKGIDSTKLVLTPKLLSKQYGIKPLYKKGGILKAQKGRVLDSPYEDPTLNTLTKTKINLHKEPLANAKGNKLFVPYVTQRMGNLWRILGRTSRVLGPIGEIYQNLFPSKEEQWLENQRVLMKEAEDRVLKGGISKAQDGTKLTGWQKVGNFLNSDYGNLIFNGVQQGLSYFSNKPKSTKADKETFIKNYIAQNSVNPNQFYQLAYQQQITSPDVHASDIVANNTAYKQAQQYNARLQNEANAAWAQQQAMQKQQSSGNNLFGTAFNLLGKLIGPKQTDGQTEVATTPEKAIQTTASPSLASWKNQATYIPDYASNLKFSSSNPINTTLFFNWNK